MQLLLTINDYQRLTKTRENIIDLLAMPDADDFDFETYQAKRKNLSSRGF